MPENTRHLTFANAICEAADICMAEDPSVYLMGLGVADPGAIFETTRGLVQKHGKNRVVEMPTSESGLTGIAIGSAMMGQRPVMSHQRVEFSLLAFENIINTAAKMRYTTNGKVSVPIVFRLIVGRGWGQGPCHAQSLESVFGHIPGLKVVLPTTAYDAKGMLISAIRDDDPTIFIEHRWLHATHGAVPEGAYEVPLDKAAVVKSGKDITIVASSFMVLESRIAASALQAAGIDAELIDLRSVRPIDMAPIRSSVSVTGRLLCVDTGWSIFGVGGEIIARIAESGPQIFKSAPKRLGMADYPSPSTRALIPNYYPYPQDILEAAIEILGLADDRADLARNIMRESQAHRIADVPDRNFSGPF